MRSELSWYQRVRFGADIGFVYALTLIFIWAALQPTTAWHNTAQTTGIPLSHLSTAATGPLVAGRPVEIVIPGSVWNGKSVDLPVDPGYYDAATDSWTLSGYRAQFATISSLANNHAGETYIYGHNNNDVFGALRHVTPAVGAMAYIHTDNGHVFAYKFASASSVAPDITSVLAYNGPPIMTIQTCTGSFNELRTLYSFAFDKVVQ